MVPTNQPESAFVMIQNILNDSFKWKYNLYILNQKNFKLNINNIKKLIEKKKNLISKI